MDPLPKPPAALSGAPNISDMYDEYLKLVKLDKRKMPEFQIRETKRAFYGAWGHMIIFFQEGLGKMEEQDAIDCMKDLTNQVTKFWHEQNRGQN